MTNWVIKVSKAAKGFEGGGDYFTCYSGATTPPK